MPFIAPAAVTADDLVVDLRSLEEAPQSPFAGARRIDVEGIDALVAEPCPRGALSFVAEAASAPLRPPTGCAKGAWPTWRWWLWVSPRRSS